MRFITFLVFIKNTFYFYHAFNEDRALLGSNPSALKVTFACHGCFLKGIRVVELPKQTTLFSFRYAIVGMRKTPYFEKLYS